MRKKFSPSGLAIPNLTIGLVAVTAIVNGFDLARGGVPVFTLPMLFAPGWWNVFLFPFRITGDWLSLALLLYMFWMFGTQLESEMGNVRYNLYMLAGYVAALLGTYFYPLTAAHVYLSVFLAIAHLAPDMEIRLMFFIPVRLKWAAAAAVAFVLWPSIQMLLVTGSPLPLFGPLIGLGNYVLFFLLPTLLGGTRPRPASIRHVQRTLSARASIHRCSVCGMTERDNPAMDFRYCVECDDREYCSVHLPQHTHVRTTPVPPSTRGSDPDPQGSNTEP